jgi:hypothetical protein
LAVSLSGEHWFVSAAQQGDEADQPCRRPGIGAAGRWPQRFEGLGQGMGQPTRDAYFSAGFNASYIIGRREARLFYPHYLVA